MQFPTKKTYVKIFQLVNQIVYFFQVTIPMNRDLLDYQDAMYQAIETVAFVEGQSTEQLLLFLLNPNTDILKIRLDRKNIEAGSILFDDAIRVYENAKSLSQRQPRMFFIPKSIIKVVLMMLCHSL